MLLLFFSYTNSAKLRKSMLEAMKIGSHLASSVIASCENVCPCFLQDKFDIVKK